MDRNSIIGIVLIGLILFGYTMYTSHLHDENYKNKLKAADSLYKIEKYEEERQAYIKAGAIKPTPEVRSKLVELNELLTPKTESSTPESKTEPTSDTEKIISDSIQNTELIEKYGSFSELTKGEESLIALENDSIKLQISTKGARIYSAQLKGYLSHDSTDLILFEADESYFRMHFLAEYRQVVSDSLYFTVFENKRIENKQVLKLRANVAGGDKYIEFAYSLADNGYLVTFDVNLIGLEDIIGKNTNSINFEWFLKARVQEKGYTWEQDNTNIYFKHIDNEVDYLSERADTDEKNISTPVKWIAMKDQFFSSVIIADTYFEGAEVKAEKVVNSTEYLKNFSADFAVAYQGTAKEEHSFYYYFGPNRFYTLQDVKISNTEGEELNLQSLVPLGWGIFGWVNRWAIIPLFKWLGSFISNYGLIIFLMTIIIKMVLFPLTYKSYLSTAKMRVLKPQIEEINSKIPKDKPMDRQQATMALYKKAGVNPMGGCLPMLLQFPILIAMFRFFPASIELRQKSFLWATDLSSYDSILDLPFNIPFYGDHVSLFTLLMAGAIVLSTRLSSEQMNDASSQMMGMKYMMYLMPIMMVFWFNNYSSGLSYYYFVSNIITYIQMVVIRRFVDDEAVLAKLNAHKKKPVVKSKFQTRLEELAKKQVQHKKRK